MKFSNYYDSTPKFSLADSISACGCTDKHCTEKHASNSTENHAKKICIRNCAETHTNNQEEISQKNRIEYLITDDSDKQAENICIDGKSIHYFYALAPLLVVYNGNFILNADVDYNIDVRQYRSFRRQFFMYRPGGRYFEGICTYPAEEARELIKQYGKFNNLSPNKSGIACRVQIKLHLLDDNFVGHDLEGQYVIGYYDDKFFGFKFD